LWSRSAPASTSAAEAVPLSDRITIGAPPSKSPRRALNCALA
jgi:hypothetical protein